MVVRKPKWFWRIEVSDPTLSERRYEIKIPIEQSSLAEVCLWLRLHPENFSPHFPQRRVNNIYFDSPDLTSVDENLSGQGERRKLRLRWYGNNDCVTQGNWEIKCKERNLGWKVTQPVGHQIQLSAMNWPEVLTILKTNAWDAVEMHLAHSNWPTLINSYDRLYYLSWDKSIRATLDFHQVFYDQRLSGTPNLTRPLPYPYRDSIVLEFKAQEASHDQLAEIVQHLPAQVTKNSKYVNGMLHAGAH